MSGGWNTIESDAGVFTELLENLGVQGVQFEELLTLDPDELAQLHPVYGVIFLFKFPTDAPYHAGDRPLDGTYDEAAGERLFFARQTIQNACATQAILSLLLNKVGQPGHDTQQQQQPSPEEEVVDVGAALADFREFAMPLPPEYRGEALSNSELIRAVHNSFARAAPFVDETQRAPDEEGEDAFHFVAYTSLDGVLYELDGLQPSPISHGACAPGTFPSRVVEVLQRRIARYTASEIRFNLLAMVRDLRQRAREIGDAEMLLREQRRRRDWRFENALRRHNFVGFTGEMLKGVVAAKVKEGGGAYDKWIDRGRDKMKKRAAERAEWKSRGQDVDMAG